MYSLENIKRNCKLTILLGQFHSHIPIYSPELILVNLKSQYRQLSSECSKVDKHLRVRTTHTWLALCNLQTPALKFYHYPPPNIQIFSGRKEWVFYYFTRKSTLDTSLYKNIYKKTNEQAIRWKFRNNFMENKNQPMHWLLWNKLWKIHCHNPDVPPLGAPNFVIEHSCEKLQRAIRSPKSMKFL